MTHTVNADLCLQEANEGFSFGTDALLLSAFVRARCRGTAIELGSGSGVISLLLQKREAFARIFAVDVQAEYAAQDGLVAQNAAQNGMAEKISPLLCDVRDLTTAHTDGEVDCVFSNPPYYTTVQGRPSAHAVRDTARHTTAGDIAQM